MVGLWAVGTRRVPSVLGVEIQCSTSTGQSAFHCRLHTDGRANYAYSASVDDPNEVSFAKGDILEVVDTTGKWFQVRTPSGQIGVSVGVGIMLTTDRTKQLPYDTVATL